MMEARNSVGRTISLLNSDDVEVRTSKVQLPPLHAHTAAYPIHSRNVSSCSSTPSLSPQTPPLVRSDSSDSRGFQTPSPLTPSFAGFDQPAYQQKTQTAPAKQHHHYSSFIASHPYRKMDDPNGSLYPPIPDATGGMPSAYPMPMPQMPMQPMQQQPQQAYRSSNSPVSEPSRVSNVSGTSNTKAQPKKNQYPCPMAKQVGCTDFFTTSGHAARHAKKHTGKKDAFCPECNKAFTRKDNMEQHRRTHQNGRGGSRSSNNDDSSRVKKPTKASSKKSSTIKAEPQQLETAIEQQLSEQQPSPMAQAQPQIIPQQAPMQQPLMIDQAMMMPPSASGPYFIGSGLDTGPVPSLPLVPDLAGIRPQLHRSQPGNSLEFMPNAAMTTDPDALHFSYPSPGLSNGLNSLALAACEHRRLSEEKSQSRSPQETPQDELP